MDKQFSRTLLPLVNDPDTYALLQAYVESRIDICRDTLEKITDVDEMRRTQGRIAELRRLLHLKDEIQNEAK
jgi:hypothetical protein